MEHLENLKRLIYSPTFSLLGKELQDLILKKQKEFLINEMEVKIHEVLTPYLIDIKEDITFDIALKYSERLSKKILTSEQSVNSKPITKKIKKARQYQELTKTIYITDVLPISGYYAYLKRGIVDIDSKFYNAIEQIFKKPIAELDEEPIDIEFDEEMYEDATVTLIDIGPQKFDNKQFYVQIRWSKKSYLGQEIKKILSDNCKKTINLSDSATNSISSRKNSYNSFSISYNPNDKCFHINLYKENNILSD